MYRIDDEQAKVREIQKYLHFVSDRTMNEVPRIAIDGSFGEQTRAAVAEFQKSKGIAVSGEVDYTTFTALYKEYMLGEFLFSSEDFVIQKEKFPFKFGDSGNEVLLLKLMLYELSKIFPGVLQVDLNAFYSRATESAVKDVRDVFMMRESVLLDLELYERMKYELLTRGAAN